MIEIGYIDMDIVMRRQRSDGVVMIDGPEKRGFAHSEALFSFLGHTDRMQILHRLADAVPGLLLRFWFGGLAEFETAGEALVAGSVGESAHTTAPVLDGLGIDHLSTVSTVSGRSEKRVGAPCQDPR